LSVTRPFDSSPGLYYKWSIVTMRLSCTVVKIWRFKDNGSRDVIGHVTVWLPVVDFLWVHSDQAST